MTEQYKEDLRPVRVSGLKDEMYPKFNFLKHRLLSIYQRFKTSKESEKLFDLVPGRKTLMQRFDDVVSPLDDTVQMIMIGSHEGISGKKTWDSIIASTRCLFGGDDNRTNVPLSEENVFELDEIKNIASRPGVIVYVLASEEDTKKSFEEALRYMKDKIPEDGHRSVILCDARFQNFITLHDFIDERQDLSNHDTLGKLVQACLEEKVVAVLQEMMKYIQKVIFPEIESDALKAKHEETSSQSVLETVHQALCEIEDGSDVESTIMHDILDRIEDQTCANLLRRYCVDASLMTKMYANAMLDKQIKQILKKLQDKTKSAIKKVVAVREECRSEINESLRSFERKSIEIFEYLLTIAFEINGVFRQAKYPVHDWSNPDISETLQAQILRISGVYGCGLMFGKLVVHIEEDSSADEEGITNKVVSIVKQSNCHHLLKHLEVKKIRLSPNTRVTYESGQSLRVKKSAGQPNGYIYGTLGCLIKGKNNIDSSERLYAVSCAHVFPDGCNQNVEISIANPHTSWEMFGNFNPELKLLKGLNVDIAAIEVTPALEQECNHCLKNSNGCDIWRSTLHDGDIRDILGFQVYKWGPLSHCTRGLVSSVNYVSQGFDSRLNVFIKSQPGSTEKFSSEGDSGSAVCFDEPFEETVQVLSLVKGEITTHFTGQYECSYSVHLKRNLEELSVQSGHSFELFSPDQ